MPAPNHLALRIESRQHGIAFRTIRREMHDTVFVGDFGNQRVSRRILCRPQPVDGNNSFDVRAVDLARRKPILVGLRDDEAVGIRLRSRQIDRFIDGGGELRARRFRCFRRRRPPMRRKGTTRTTMPHEHILFS